ncbi:MULTISPECIES: hypothetical protein [unclassified Halomonas]|nr:MULTISPECIES: hypothetical protein [unclassified Halomonas]UZH12086.1 hypothetical protein OM794_10265 [Halomonas sp. BDJS001]
MQNPKLEVLTPSNSQLIFIDQHRCDYCNCESRQSLRFIIEELSL